MVAGPVVCMETMRRVGIDHDLDRLVCRLGLRLRFLDARDRDAAILTAVETEQRALDVGCDVEGGLGLDRCRRAAQGTIERDRGSQMRIMGRIEPGLAT